jgi:hypothetical protein
MKRSCGLQPVTHSPQPGPGHDLYQVVDHRWQERRRQQRGNEDLPSRRDIGWAEKSAIVLYAVIYLPPICYAPQPYRLLRMNIRMRFLPCFPLKHEHYVRKHTE